MPTSNPDLVAFLDLPQIRSYLAALGTLNLDAWERALCITALDRAGSIVEAAELLGITRHAFKRRIIKHQIRWPRSSPATTVSVPAAPS